MTPNQSIKSGDDSTNFQSQRDVNVVNNYNYGPSLDQVKELVYALFKENFIHLRDEARKVAEERATELNESFLDRLHDSFPHLIGNVANPDVQYVIYEAQKSYARRGGKDLSELLVDLLVDRTKEKDGKLIELVLNESLETVPKLTSSQIDILSICFLLKYTRQLKIGNLQALKGYFQKFIDPFLPGVTKERSSFQHIEYTRCGSLSIASTDLINVLKKSYGGLFSAGFPKEEIAKIGLPESTVNSLFLKCLNEQSLVQLNALSEEMLPDLMQQHGLSQDQAQQILMLYRNYLLKDDAIKSLIVAKCQNFSKLLDYWESSQLPNLELTSVGIAIAHANIRRKTGETFDLSIWIK